jgi:hypothetical protein
MSLVPAFGTTRTLQSTRQLHGIQTPCKAGDPQGKDMGNPLTDGQDFTPVAMEILEILDNNWAYCYLFS